METVFKSPVSFASAAVVSSAFVSSAAVVASAVVAAASLALLALSELHPASMDTAIAAVSTVARIFFFMILSFSFL